MSSIVADLKTKITVMVNQEFHRTIKSGEIKDAKAIYDAFPDVDFVKYDDILDAFRRACVEGHMEYAGWLHATFPDAFGKQRDEALKYAEKNGHAEVAVWLKSLA